MLIYCTVFGSGIASVTAILQTLSSGDKLVVEENVYGCTYPNFRAGL